MGVMRNTARKSKRTLREEGVSPEKKMLKRRVKKTISKKTTAEDQKKRSDREKMRRSRLEGRTMRRGRSGARKGGTRKLPNFEEVKRRYKKAQNKLIKRPTDERVQRKGTFNEQRENKRRGQVIKRARLRGTGAGR